MAEEAPRWRSDIYGILPHPSEPRILLIPGQAGWTLPHARLEERIWLDKLGVVDQQMRQVLGIPVNAYRYADYAADEEEYTEAGVYVLTNGAPTADPPVPGQWVERATLAGLPLRRPEHRRVLDAYFAERAGGIIPEHRPPWAHDGWLGAAISWIAAELARQGSTLVPPVEQVRNWSLSCILRARTTTETIYFKAPAPLPLFVDEPALMQHLAGLYPDHVPRPLSIDRRRRWMLLADFGRPIGWEAPLELREAMLRTWGGLQLAAVDRGDALLAAGCIDRRLHWLAAQIDALVGDPEALFGLDDAEVAQLHRLAPRFKAMCDELAAYRVPPTLVHGDLDGGNVALRHGKFLFFDWTDACIAHPFFDLMTILKEEETVQEQLGSGYLALWAGYEPPARLRSAWRLARPLCALHHAVSYQHITANLEARTKQEFRGDAASWLRQAMRLLPDYDRR